MSRTTQGKGGAKNVSLRGEAGADKNEGGVEGGPPPQQNVSLRGPGADKNEGGGVERDPPSKNVSLRGAGVDLPACQERRRGKHKSTLRGAGRSGCSQIESKSKTSTKGVYWHNNHPIK